MDNSELIEKLKKYQPPEDIMEFDQWVQIVEDLCPPGPEEKTKRAIKNESQLIYRISSDSTYYDVHSIQLKDFDAVAIIESMKPEDFSYPSFHNTFRGIYDIYRQGNPDPEVSLLCKRFIRSTFKNCSDYSYRKNRNYYVPEMSPGIVKCVNSFRNSILKSIVRFISRNKRVKVIAVDSNRIWYIGPKQDIRSFLKNKSRLLESRQITFPRVLLFTNNRMAEIDNRGIVHCRCSTLKPIEDEQVDKALLSMRFDHLFDK